MYRLVVFGEGGIVKYDRNPGDVPVDIVNELVASQIIAQSSRVLTQGQIRLGPTGEYAARLVHHPEEHVYITLVYPSALNFKEPDAVVADVAKIWASAHEDPERFKALADVRLKNITPAHHSHHHHHHPNHTRNETHNALKNGEKEKTPVSDSATEDRDTAAAAAEPAANVKEVAKKTKAAKRKGKGGKKKRTWDGEGGLDSDSDTILDYSEATPTNEAGANARDMPVEALDALDLGSRSKQGFVVKELTAELGEILSNSGDDQPPEQFGFLKRFVGGKKLDDASLQGAITAMEDHLVAKNVAKDVATAICEQVRKDLVGTSTKSWTSVKATVRESIQRSLSRILTPTMSTDLLAAIKSKTSHRHPYVVSVVGVNGVGKSTNLGKLAFWFLQNDFRVLVAACDTFRSGAVEQLKVHVHRLAKLKGTHGHIELFDQGYGKDAAVIAKRAVEHGTKHGYDVVLIDTAGRRHNDDRLMSSLEKFGNYAQPDKIIMVGEALVGTDSVEQAKNFNAAFGKSRGLDFFLISKCDTVGEMLGTLVNVTYSTGVPVLFVGVGQQYTDLRTLSVEWAVDKLLS